MGAEIYSVALTSRRIIITTQIEFSPSKYRIANTSSYESCLLLLLRYFASWKKQWIPY